MEEELVERLARALKAEAARFRDPVDLYVETEALTRWREANPDGDPFDDCPDRDWDGESWGFLARACLSSIASAGLVIVGKEAIEEAEERGWHQGYAAVVE